jgi:hypothetical protein
MFLIPAIVAATVIEYTNAIKTTEKQSVNVDVRGSVQPSAPDGPRVTRPPKHIHEDSNDMSDKQLVVFGSSDTPGIVSTTATGEVQQYLPYSQLQQYTQQEIASSPLVRQACEFAVKSVFPGFTPSFIVTTAADLCFKAIYKLTVKGLILTEKTVLIGVKYLWEKMSKAAKNQLPWKQTAKAAKASTKAVNKMKGPIRTNPINNSLSAMPVSAPAAQSMVTGRLGQPKIKNNRRGVIINHSEMLNTLTASVSASNYKVTNYVINPAKADIFPWLSSIATSYDKYRMRKLRVTLNSVQPTTVAGKYGIGYDPDSTDDMPVDRSEVYAMYKHMESPVWQSICLDVPVSGRELFCNTHAVSDSKLVDDGMIILFADLISTASLQLADVIVEYEVELLDPQQALFMTQVENFTGVVYTATKALVPTYTHGPNLSTIIIGSATTIYIVPSPGYYKIEIMAYDSAAASPVITVTNSTTNNMYGMKMNSTTINLTTFVCRVYTNSVNASSGAITGEYLGLTLSGAANWLALENLAITVSRIAPPVWANYLTTGWTTTAATGTL